MFLQNPWEPKVTHRTLCACLFYIFVIISYFPFSDKPPMTQPTSMGTKKGAKKNLGKPPPGKSSQPPEGTNPSLVTPISHSAPEQDPQAPVPINLDSTPPSSAPRKRPAKINQEELDVLARQYIEVFHTAQADVIFANEDEV